MGHRDAMYTCLDVAVPQLLCLAVGGQRPLEQRAHVVIVAQAPQELRVRQHILCNGLEGLQPQLKDLPRHRVGLLAMPLYERCGCIHLRKGRATQRSVKPSAGKLRGCALKLGTSTQSQWPGAFLSLMGYSPPSENSM